MTPDSKSRSSGVAQNAARGAAAPLRGLHGAHAEACACVPRIPRRGAAPSAARERPRRCRLAH